MDADLQDPPEALPEFIAKWRKGYDVIYAIREHRKEKWLKRSSYALFYRLLRRVANIDIPLDSGDFCVMTVGSGVAEVYQPGVLYAWNPRLGLNQVGLPFERHARYAVNQIHHPWQVLLPRRFDLLVTLHCGSLPFSAQRVAFLSFWRFLFVKKPLRPFPQDLPHW
jgi:hypothetical protein